MTTTPADVLRAGDNLKRRKATVAERRRNGVLMTEQPTPRAIRQSIAEKLAGLPGNVDENGKSDLDRQSDADRFARFTEAQTPEPDADPGPHAMRPNRAQGSGATVPTPAPTNVRDAIRAQLAKLDNI